MSGGSFDYHCFTLEQYYVGKMQDIELNKMIKDLAKVLHDLEWWQSDDISEEEYRETVRKFKNKWFGKRDDTSKECVKEILENALKELDGIK